MKLTDLPTNTIVRVTYPVDGATALAQFAGITGTGRAAVAHFVDDDGTEWDAIRAGRGWAVATKDGTGPRITVTIP